MVAPVVPATQEAEKGGLLNPTSLRPAWAWEQELGAKVRTSGKGESK
jgi:hypothetical protein